MMICVLARLLVWRAVWPHLINVLFFFFSLLHIRSARFAFLAFGDWWFWRVWRFCPRPPAFFTPLFVFRHLRTFDPSLSLEVADFYLMRRIRTLSLAPQTLCHYSNQLHHH